jgi:hypothetical protein
MQRYQRVQCTEGAALRCARLSMPTGQIAEPACQTKRSRVRFMTFAQIARRARSRILTRLFLKLGLAVAVLMWAINPQAGIWQQVGNGFGKAGDWMRLAAIKGLRGGTADAAATVTRAGPLDLLQQVNGYPATEIRCLALAIYYEAGRAPVEAGLGVAQIVLNRAAAAKAPRQLCKIVYSGLTVPGGCLFETACRNVGIAPRQTAALDKAVETAVAVVTGTLGAGPELTKATHFHEKRAAPAWSRGMFKAATIGSLVFYVPEQPESAADPLPVAGTIPSAVSRQGAAPARRATREGTSATQSSAATAPRQTRELSRQVFGID